MVRQGKIFCKAKFFKASKLIKPQNTEVVAGKVNYRILFRF